MAIEIINKTGGAFPVTRQVGSSADHAALPNNCYFEQIDLNYLVRYKDSSGAIVDAFGSSGGKIGIPNATTGIFSWYSTLEAARDAAVSGDTIHVYPGTYVVTTTATNGLAKDGIKYYFYYGAVVTKSTSGSLFRNNAFASGFDVTGYGNFQTSGSAGNVYIIEGSRINIDTIFEAAYASSSTTHTIRTNCTAGTYTALNTNSVKINNVISTNGSAFYTSGAGLLMDIDFGNCQSTSTYAIYIGAPETIGRINTINVKSSTSTAILADYTSYNSRISFNGVSYIPGGSGSSFFLDGDSYANLSYFNINAPSGMMDVLATGTRIMTLELASGAVISSSIIWSKVIMYSDTLKFTGTCIYLDLRAGEFHGEVTGALVQSGGRFNGVIRYSGRGDFSGATISGGVAIIQDFGHIYNKLTVSGTADVSLYSYYTGANNGGASYNGAISLTAGTLRILGHIKNLNTANTSGTYPCIDWTGGTLILHSSASFYCGSSDSAAIKATGSMTGKIYGNVVSNTADTGTITWQVGTGANRIVDTNVR